MQFVHVCQRFALFWAGPLAIAWSPALLSAARSPNPSDYPTPTAVRVVGPDRLAPGTLHLLRIEILMPRETNWTCADPSQFTISLSGDARILPEPSGRASNPLTIETFASYQGQALLTVHFGPLTHEERLRIAPQTAIGTLRLALENLPNEVSRNEASGTNQEGASASPSGMHGLGIKIPGHSQFWEGQAGESNFRWCLGDLDAKLVQINIGRTFETENDNGDWRLADETQFDFSSFDPLLQLLHRARQTDPDLKIFATLDGPPLWMLGVGKNGESLNSDARIAAPRELAEYLQACLRYAAARGVAINYIGPSDSPDWGPLAESLPPRHSDRKRHLWQETAIALEQLHAADEPSSNLPQWILPEPSTPAASLNLGDSLARFEAQSSNFRGQGIATFRLQASNWLQDATRPASPEALSSACQIWAALSNRHGEWSDLANLNDFNLHLLKTWRSEAEVWIVSAGESSDVDPSALIRSGPKTHASNSAQDSPFGYWRSKSYYAFQQLADATPINGQRTTSLSAEWTDLAVEDPESDVAYLVLQTDNQFIIHLANASSAPIRYALTWPIATPFTDNARIEGRVTGPYADNEPLLPEAVERVGGRARLLGEAPPNSLVTRILPTGLEPSHEE